MRVTNRMLANNFLTDMTTNLNNLQTLQQQLTSGKEIRRPSDDPLKVARAMQLHSEISSNKQYNENIKDTLSWLQQTDTALGQLGKQSQRVRELLVSAGDPTYGPDERKKINDEIKEIIGQMSQTLNSSFDGRYVFGGTRGTSKPVNVVKGPMVTKPQKTSKSPDGSGDAKVTVTEKFNPKENTDYTVIIGDGGKATVTFKENGKEMIPQPSKTDDKWDLGNGIKFEIDGAPKDGDKYEFTALAAEEKLVYADRDGTPMDKTAEDIKIMSEKLVTEVSQGVRVEYNITAVDVINFKDNKGNERDLREILEDIVTHLESPNSEDIKEITNGDLEALDAVMDNVLKLRSQAGAKGNRMESALEKNKEENFNLKEILSKTEDIDMVEKTMEYAVAITVYMASLQTSARVLQPTLMDYVR